MPKVIFKPNNVEVEVGENTKLLVAANRAKVPIRFGCGACRCGTCGVAVTVIGSLSPMEEREKTLLTQMKLNTEGGIRLACQARIIHGTATVDLDFQDTYSPAESEDSENEVGDEYLT